MGCHLPAILSIVSWFVFHLVSVLFEHKFTLNNQLWIISCFFSFFFFFFFFFK